MKDFKSAGKTVEGNEGDKCHYPTRLDTYGCGCSHDCSYCYAKSLLDFRGLWNPTSPSVGEISNIAKEIKKLKKEGKTKAVRLGGMTDCFQPIEKVHRVTYKTIKLLNALGIDKICIEFLRVNPFIRKQFNIDYFEYAIKQSGYYHMSLRLKKKYISNITGFKEMTVCEDETEAYEYWHKYFNHNKDDCCNLRWTNV